MRNERCKHLTKFLTRLILCQKEVLHFIEFTLTKYNIDNKIQESTQPASPFSIYQSLNLGKGGYSQTPSSEAKQGLCKLLKKKHNK